MSSTNRRTKLKQWIDEKFNGSVADFCHYYGMPTSKASYIHQLISGHRTFGERAARKLEDETKRPSGWLDQQLVAEEQPIRFDGARVAGLNPEQRLLIEDFIGFMLDRQEKTKRASQVSKDAEPEKAPLILKTKEELSRFTKRPITKITLSRREKQSTNKIVSPSTRRTHR